MSTQTTFDLHCTACPRLRDSLQTLRAIHPDYHNQPVRGFGVTKPKLLIVGLAPGLHGANRTGRPFTGDAAGIILYKMLYHYGFSNQLEASSLEDGLKLLQTRITNAVKCYPPQNKPTTNEATTCNHFLKAELNTLAKKAIILCLGTIAHKAVIQAFKLKQSEYQFQHGVIHQLENGLKIIDSYHCSRYNMNTKRLTEAMFHVIFKTIKAALE